MSVTNFLQSEKSNRSKGIAILIDPDQHGQKTKEIFNEATKFGIKLFLVGGSLVSKGNTEQCVLELKKLGAPYVVLFPGHEMQVVNSADAILFLSLISGRNPEFLIGKHVTAAPWIKKQNLEAIPTGYMLVESGKLTSAQYMSGSLPMPNDKPDIAAATAMAGELLGMKALYLDAGSGAQFPIQPEIIKSVSTNTNSILFVGGGIKSAHDAQNAWNNGADFIVIGNGIFDRIDLLAEICNSQISIA